MLDALSPNEISVSEQGIKARVGPIVLELECSARDAQRLSEPEAMIYCQLETDDETLHLVGFSSENRRELYRSLRRVSGIGRRSALVVLDCGEAIDILRAVAGKDTGFFRSVPGVGPKRIDAIVRELEKRFSSTLPSPIPVPVANWVEARDGLMSMGQSPQEADRLLRAAAVEGMDAEALLTAARTAMAQADNPAASGHS